MNSKNSKSLLPWFAMNEVDGSQARCKSRRNPFKKPTNSMFNSWSSRDKFSIVDCRYLWIIKNKNSYNISNIFKFGNGISYSSFSAVDNKRSNDSTFINAKTSGPERKVWSPENTSLLPANWQTRTAKLAFPSEITCE